MPPLRSPLLLGSRRTERILGETGIILGEPDDFPPHNGGEPTYLHENSRRTIGEAATKTLGRIQSNNISLKSNIVMISDDGGGFIDEN